ncbi:MAG TPA: carboxypeptidase M32, partial [Herpetosiphonaceae bacterium]
MSREEALSALKQRLATVNDLAGAYSVLSWDQQTYMPEQSVADRAEQMTTLSKLAHELAVDPEVGRLLDALDGQFEPGSDEEALVRVARRNYLKETKLPTELVAELTRTTALAESAWARARAESDWAMFAPHLEKMVDLQRQVARQLNPDIHPFDALLDWGEPGMSKAQIETMYEELKAGTVPLIRAIAERSAGETRDAALHGDYPEPLQERFGETIISRFGYDWNRGRQDRTVHPFCTSFGIDDVRITTRFDPAWLSPALFGTLHESGHALYEQGVSKAYARTPLAGGASMGVHESQSRLWENLVGRSRPFWSHFYPKLQETFPERLGGVALEDFYKAINTVQPSFIRVEADELTYNMHTLLRFELELELLDGTLSVADLPAAWNAKMEAYLGITPPDDAQGALQDVHWSSGLFAYFPTYTIGNVLSVQLFEEAVKAHPEIPAEMERGEFGALLGWLRENIHQYGSKYEPNELVTRATGRPMDTA